MPSNRFLRRAARRADAAKSKPVSADSQMDQDQGEDQPQPDQPQSITDDPKAMQLVDELKQMGYTADDVAQAMGDDDQDQSSSAATGAAATQAASLQLPGLS